VKLSYFIDCADDLGVAFVEAEAATAAAAWTRAGSPPTRRRHR
jgi:hypothetical protein